jgi:hypothetical protein
MFTFISSPFEIVYLRFFLKPLALKERISPVVAIISNLPRVSVKAFDLVFRDDTTAWFRL